MPPLNLGVRAHDFGRLPAAELAARISRHGLTCIQLAPAKATTEVAADAPVEPAVARAVGGAFHAHGVEIAVLGCYINLGARDAAAREPELRRFVAQVRSARDFGGGLVGTETGSLNPDFSRHRDNSGEEAFGIVREGVRVLARAAEAAGVLVGIEPVERYVISSPRRLKRLLDEIGSPQLRVILDPVNLLSADNHEAQDEIVAEALDLLGDHIAVVHAKDFTVREGRLEELPAGRGQLRYGPLLRWVKEHQPGLPVILENTHPSTIGESIVCLRRAYDAA